MTTFWTTTCLQLDASTSHKFLPRIASVQSNQGSGARNLSKDKIYVDERTLVASLHTITEQTSCVGNGRYATVGKHPRTPRQPVFSNRYS
jgi:hypothetical protein